MPLFTLINSWKKLLLISATLYIPTLVIITYLSVEQSTALAFGATALAWASYMVHLMLISPPTTLPSPLEREQLLLF